jgi:hypothetical protein
MLAKESVFYKAAGKPSRLHDLRSISHNWCARRRAAIKPPGRPAEDHPVVTPAVRSLLAACAALAGSCASPPGDLAPGTGAPTIPATSDPDQETAPAVTPEKARYCQETADAVCGKLFACTTGERRTPAFVHDYGASAAQCRQKVVPLCNASTCTLTPDQPALCLAAVPALDCASWIARDYHLPDSCLLACL